MNNEATDSKIALVRAALFLLSATVLWGASFPFIKALVYLAGRDGAGLNTWFISADIVLARFGVAALILGAFCGASWKKVTRISLFHGSILGIFAGGGLILQTDGLAHTSASVSAFLTQFYVLVIPVLKAVWGRRFPSWRVMAGCVLVLYGMALLSGVDWSVLRLGRGEWETLAASIVFTGQILWLERPDFLQADLKQTTAIMFAVMALMAVPMVACQVWSGGSLAWMGASWAALVLLALLIVACTLGAYLVMNRWQPQVDAVVAALIYCVEPVMASLFALFLPSWISALSGLAYSNEALTSNLVIGGCLVTAANVLVATAGWRRDRLPKVEPGA